MQPHHTTQPQTPGINTTAQDLTISAGKAQLLSMLYFLPLAILFGLSYILLWPNKFGKSAYQGALPDNLSSTTMLALFIAVIFAGIVVHELIHGITWSMFAKKGFRSIQFGVLWKSFNPLLPLHRTAQGRPLHHWCADAGFSVRYIAVSDFPHHGQYPGVFIRDIFYAGCRGRFFDCKYAAKG